MSPTRRILAAVSRLRVPIALVSVLFMCAGIFVLATPRANASAGTETIFLTSGTSWTVPSDWNNAVNTIEVIGGGGGGGNGYASMAGAGAGYSKITNLTLTPGASVSYSVGSGGAGGAASNSADNTGGTVTSFCIGPWNRSPSGLKVDPYVMNIRIYNVFFIDNADSPAQWSGFSFDSNSSVPEEQLRIVSAIVEAADISPRDNLAKIAPAVLKTQFSPGESSNSPEVLLSFQRRYGAGKQFTYYALQR